MNYTISVICPIYNEIKNIKKSIRKINEFLNSNFDDYEIILIESGSTDGSFEECDNLAFENPKIKVFHQGSRKGFGSALKLGYKKSTKDLVWQVPIDLPFSLDSINYALPFFKNYDCVLSYRSSDNRNIKRKIISFFYNLLVKLVFNLKVKHVNSAFKVFRKKAIKKMKISSNGWFIDTEVIYRLQKSNIKFIEIPVKLIDRTAGQSSVTIKSFIKTLKEAHHFYKTK